MGENQAFSFPRPKNSNELEEQTILNQEIVQLYKAIHQLLPPFPKTEHYTLINHPMELTVDEETEIYIESSGGKWEGNRSEGTQ